ncbi:small integral membrane protein 13, partial [Notamacropus eugenii]|uniref:small integral membrane protein 13 n=1 Tax=Notamacropus eugenii TaxID=9315 RepID=UPI003B66DEA5
GARGRYSSLRLALLPCSSVLPPRLRTPSRSSLQPRSFSASASSPASAQSLPRPVGGAGEGAVGPHAVPRLQAEEEESLRKAKRPGARVCPPAAPSSAPPPAVRVSRPPPCPLTLRDVAERGADPAGDRGHAAVRAALHALRSKLCPGSDHCGSTESLQVPSNPEITQHLISQEDSNRKSPALPSRSVAESSPIIRSKGWYVVWHLFLSKFKFLRELIGDTGSQQGDNEPSESEAEPESPPTPQRMRPKSVWHRRPPVEETST